MKHIFRIVIVIATILCFNSTTFGQMLFQEDFITPTADVSTLPGWAVLTGVGGTATTPTIAVNAGSALTYPGYIESGVGNSAFLTGAGGKAQASFTGGVASGLVYVAFMIKVDSASAAGDYCIMIRNSSNHNRWRMWIKALNSGWTMGLSKGAGSTVPPVYATTSYNFGKTYLVVAKYDYNTAASTTDALLSLWVNPAASSFGKTEDATPAIAPFQETGTSDFVSPAMNRFALIQNGATTAPTFTIGGIRMATDWKTVLPPAPMYYNFSGSGDVSNTANWGANLDGTGTGPSDFASDNQWYLIRNSDAANVKNLDLNTIWPISGAGSKLIIGAGVNFNITSSAALVGKVDVSANGVLNIAPQDNLFWPSFGTVSGTVNFDNTAGFTLSGDQVLPSSSGFYILKSGNINLGSAIFTIKGKFKPNLNLVSGNGTFTLDSAGTLFIKATTGITKTDAKGEIQTATRNFSRYGSYEYNGAANQVTGDALPDTVQNITVNMDSKALTTTLTKATVAAGNLGLTRGKLVIGNVDLIFNNPTGGSDSSYVITNGTGAVGRSLTVTSTTSAKTMHVGSISEYRKAAFTLESVPTVAMNFSFRYVADTTDAGFNPMIHYRYKPGYWSVASSSATNPTYRLDLYPPANFADTTALRVVYRADKTAIWDTIGSIAHGYALSAVNQAGIDRFGQFAIGVGDAISAVNDKSVRPGKVELAQNYPNPFNPTTVISYSLPKEMKVSLTVYNVVGSEVMTLVNQNQNAGSYNFSFNGANLGSGVYFYRLTTGSTVITKKMMLLK